MGRSGIEQKPFSRVPVFEALQNFSDIDVVLFLQLLLSFVRAFDFSHVPPTADQDFVYTIYAAFSGQSIHTKLMINIGFFYSHANPLGFVYTKITRTADSHPI